MDKRYIIQYKKNETDLSKIERLASIREDENLRFRVFLKNKESDKIDKIVHRLHNEITKQIDCTLCANCCCHSETGLCEDDIIRLAELEGITPEDYLDNYCEKDVLSGTFLKSLPCRYLEEKKCRIYENRPKECQHFPHTHKERFTSRLYGMLRFYEFCPIVFNLMERLKEEVRFRRSI
jgi:Fe-S-cluster containining protein